MIKKKYKSPNYDEILDNLGFTKFENHPIYIRSNVVGEFNWEIIFNSDFKGHQKCYEIWVKDGLITKEELQKRLTTDYIYNSVCLTFARNLRYELLIDLTIRFYYYNGDKVNMNKQMNLYKKLTGKVYFNKEDYKL